MLDFHIQNKAHVSVAARPVPLAEASSFGVIKADKKGKIERFEEKPKNPSPMVDDPNQAYVSMGNYIFNTDTLLESLAESQKKKEHDFGSHILPNLVSQGNLYAYDFSQNVIPDIKPYEETAYWRDVGTIETFWKTHMDMLGEKPIFDIYNDSWPIHPALSRVPSAKINGGTIINSSISDGVIINYATIKNSVIRSGVVIEEGVEINDSIIFDGVHIKSDSKLNKVIVDKNNVIKQGEQLGFDQESDKFKLHIDKCGIGILPKKRVIPAE